jgi:uncharacterized protein HemX
MKTVLQKIPMWSKWLAAVVAGLGAVWVIIGWGADTYKHFEKKEHHDQDIQILLQDIAERDQKMQEQIANQIREDRIQRNMRELQRLQRDLVGQKFGSEAEKEFILAEIQRLERAILCDQQGVCR